MATTLERVQSIVSDRLGVDAEKVVPEAEFIGDLDADSLDLVEVMELDGARIGRHRIYWGWRGTEHIIANAVSKATPT